MDRAELLSEFKSRVDKFEKFQTFIDKAKSQAGKFASQVVEKVVKDNTDKSIEVVGEIIPLMADMETVINEMEAEKEAAVEHAKDSKFKLEELELRHMIGDLTPEAFEDEAREHKEIVESTESEVQAIDEELGRFGGAIERWQELGTKAGMMPDASDNGVDEVEVEEEEEEEEEIEMVEEEEDVDMSAFEEGDRDGSHVKSVSIAEDLSDVFDGDDAADDDEGFEVGDLDILGDDEEIELEAGSEEDEEDEEDDDAPRRSVLLYQEGTAEEQIYPFTGDVMSLGRGRDNDVQVKNDSKVSRYHCKLYRRGPNFYIEDNKSANGTLVNGELITERRLFGGEEVIIGETFFRFRILD